MAGCGRARRGAVAAAVAGCAVLLGAGCGSSAPATTADPPAHTSSTPVVSAATLTPAQRRALAARYLAIARAGNRGLDHALDPLQDRDKNRLGHARADLRYAAGVEHRFDRRLLRIPFPPEIERVARKLHGVNQDRASLTAVASQSTSLPELHRYERRLDDANKPVEAAVKTIRRRLGLAPPPSS